MDSKPQIIRIFRELNNAYLEIIEHNVNELYDWKSESFRQDVIQLVEPCCSDHQLEYLYNLYNNFITNSNSNSITTQSYNNAEYRKYMNVLIAAILFMYYNMVLIETHDNELLSNSIPRSSSGKILAPNFLTIKHVFFNCSLFNDLDREHAYNKFVEFYTNILISDETAYGTIRRFFLGPTFSERRNSRSRSTSKQK